MIKYIIGICIILSYIGLNRANCERAQKKEKMQYEVLSFYYKQLGKDHLETIKNVVEYTRARNYRIDACSVVGDGKNPHLFEKD